MNRSFRLGLAALALWALHAAAQAGAEQPLAALPYAPSLDLGSLDRSVDACVDFYRFSCGGWQQKNPIPLDQPSWDVYSKLQDENLRYLWGLLAEAAEQRAERTPAEQKTGDYFAACMDEAAVDAAGARPLQPALARVAALGSIKSMASLVAQLHMAGTDSALFRFGSEQDHANSNAVIAGADAGGLGLPDRDLYLKADARSVATRVAYRGHVAQILQLLGDAPAAARAHAMTVLQIETALARSSLTLDERRDPHKLYHRMSLAALQRLAPHFDWASYWLAVGVAPDTPVNVAEPAFFRRVDALLAERSLAEWKTYLRWHAAHAQAPYLSQDFVQAHFAFYAAKLNGVERLRPRWNRCVRWVDRDLGEALGRVFVQRTFSPETRQRAAEMTRKIEAAMRERIRELDWMSPRTKQAALAKLGAMVNKIGYPERWRDYTALEVRRDDFFGNVERSQVFESRRQLAKIGRPVDRDEWAMTPPAVNAYYDPQLVSINFPAGILQPPLFDPQMDDAPNYGNTGATIGHELTHAFDDEGRHFDANGNLRNWWSAKDAAEFNRRTACVVQQYGGYTAVDEVKINGRLTLGENVADLGGTMLAYLAWKAATAGQALEPRDGFTAEQRFFIGAAQWACSNERPETLRQLALTDAHAPNRFRVNGVLANLPEFAHAFACKPGQPMVRAQRCKVW